ncbi:AfsR/SARP family transcriptional regulator [Acrocarpospora catenulata]|uniref:AfsR/SARP family transcriptional regulator n=1 Tax=Acrocarpospora catenulata TaxID=2836182 RepID=UPI001BD9ACBC|nr:AfsR/SARP family transcriptional regulator [Acrocarpospora catenulata]
MPKIEFCVLGPLQLGAEGRRVQLKSPRQQVVLAALLLNADRMVPVESLITAVWDERPPDGARHQIHNCVWMLRRRLRDVGVPAAEITGYPAGYTIHLGESRLDAAVFDRWLAEAREFAALGQTTLAAARLRSALSLWQGPPLSGVPGRIMQRAAVQLTERRLSAQEEWLDLEIALGRSAEVTAELHRLVAEQPFRERLRAQLMRALYRSGRTAEALAVYRQTRRLYIDELGLEPGPLLRDLEEAILRGDRNLAEVSS